VLVLPSCKSKEELKERWIKSDSVYSDLGEALAHKKQCKVLVLRNTIPSGQSISHPKSIDHTIGELAQLHTLVIYGVMQADIPAEICSLKELKTLELHGYGKVNSELVLPDCLSELSKLQSLTIHHCLLSSVPALPANLRQLSLRDNQIAEVPSSLFSLRLDKLDLANNQINAINLTEENVYLHWFDVSHNQLTTYPSTLVLLKGLNYLSLSYNPMAAIDSMPPVPAASRAELVGLPLAIAQRFLAPTTSHLWMDNPGDSLAAAYKSSNPHIKFMWFDPSNKANAQ
jgi:hypothetical protein